MSKERFIKPREPKSDGSHHNHAGRRSFRQHLEAVFHREDEYQLTVDQVDSMFREIIPDDQEITLWEQPDVLPAKDKGHIIDKG